MPIVLLTDFGSSDGYVGVLKGVIAKVAPHAQVIDLAHDLPPFDILNASLVLYQAYRYFPAGSIFVAVVDPGVGSERKPILVETENYFFVGPDNGIFTLALSEQKIRGIFHLKAEKYFLHPVSSTFHGRDIFAPVAAHLTHGVTLDQLGSPLTDYHRLPEWSPQMNEQEMAGQIVAIDWFGNAITNFKKPFLEKHFPDLDFTAVVGARHAVPLRGINTHYAEGKEGQPILLFNSANLLEISANRGSAAEILGLRRGDSVKILMEKP